MKNVRSIGALTAGVALALSGAHALGAKPGGGGGTRVPSISATPTSLAFGNQALGATSAAKAITVGNSGRANLTISSVTLAGTAAASYARTTNCVTTLAPGATCTVNVTFTPQASGAAPANVAIASNASNAPNLALALSGTGVTVSARRIEGAGDSIMRGYNATCATNTGLFDFLCYGGGDQPENSFLDGSSTRVLSIVDRYVQSDPLVGGGKAASQSGSEMTDPAKNNFAAQATAIVGATTQPARVFVELGGNDLCNRATVAALYSDATWEAAVRAGLDTLVNGLPDNSTVLLVSVPRVQDLRAAGLAKQQTTSGVNCQNFWASYDVCPIATAGGTDLATRLAAVGERQRAYNDKLVALAAEYNGRAITTGVEVVAEFEPTTNASVGSYSFQAADLNGGDCFHPSIQGQNRLSEIVWGRNPWK